MPLVIPDPLDQSQYLVGGSKLIVGAKPDEVVTAAGDRLVPGALPRFIACRRTPVGIAVEVVGAHVVEKEVVGVVLELMGDGPDRVDGRLPPRDGPLVQGRLQHAELPLVVLRQLVDQGGIYGGEHVTVTRHGLVDALQVAGRRQQQGGDQHQGAKHKRQRGQDVIAFLDDRSSHYTTHKMSLKIHFMVKETKPSLIEIISGYCWGSKREHWVHCYICVPEQ